MHYISVKTGQREDLIDITDHIRGLVAQYGADKRACIVYVPHTTAAVTINENADPDVKRDILYGLDLIVPATSRYRHLEGNSPAHIKASLMGASQYILIDNGKLVLGTWQGIYLAEFDGPRTRKVVVQLI